jgi:hypothetical protein
MEKPTIKKVIDLLEDLRKKDQDAFDLLINHKISSNNIDLPTYSLLSVLNEIFGGDKTRIGIWFDKETNKTEKIMFIDEKTFELMYSKQEVN